MPRISQKISQTHTIPKLPKNSVNYVKPTIIKISSILINQLEYITRMYEFLV
jgi:hypothetical protein